MRYTVIIEETAQYEIEVEAQSDWEAATLAEKAFLNAIACDFPTVVIERDIIETKAA
jgi:hypothetical protein